MHLRDTEGGGSFVQTNPSHERDASILTNRLSDRSSTRSTTVQSLPFLDSPGDIGHELLLAWLILFCFNKEDAPSHLTWARISVAGYPRECQLPAVSPFSARDSLSSALLAIRSEYSTDIKREELEGPCPTIFINNGATITQRSAKSVCEEADCNWTYQLEASVQEQQLVLKAHWRESSFSSRVAISQLDSFVDILLDVLDHPLKLVSDVFHAKQNDLAQIWNWNKTVPATVDECMHDIISRRAQVNPTVVAIQSWDGDLTYEQVDAVSTELASTIRSTGLATGDVVPLCFEKSRWTVVAVLAVMKAGGTFSLTDPSQPEVRLRTIVEQTEAKLIITSRTKAGLGRLIAPAAKVLVISEEMLDLELPITIEPLPAVPADMPMYIIFTSGSTGKPKGVIITHEQYSSGAIPRAAAVGYRAHSRVFDFASYAFDVSIDCMLCTLANGGCLCIPSDDERMNDLSGAIRRSRANMVHTTPSVARVLAPDILPSLDVLGLGGEAVSSSDASVWSRQTNVVIAYGPSECTVGCTINNDIRRSTNLGYGVGGLTWVVDPADHDYLMPLGAIGELLIEGPIVGRGYLKEAEKTAQVFIHDPRFLLAGGGHHPGRRGRVYKTGDLVKYDSSGTGSIVFLGRKDQQVKLRGQRIELAEIEHHLQRILPPGVKVVAEVIKPIAGEPTLVAFVSEAAASPSHSPPILAECSPGLEAALQDVESSLAVDLPRYMLPSSFIPLLALPSLVSGKTDRKKLRQFGSTLSRDQLASLATRSRREEPQTDIERKLQGIWRSILGIDIQIGLGDNFFSLGGNSLRAMKLVGTAREESISLKVATVFRFPALRDMAANADAVLDSSAAEVLPFSLLPDEWNPSDARAEAAKLCDISEEEVEDIYQCTALQEALMALSAKVKEAYVAQRVVELENEGVARRFQSAVETAMSTSPILRTRIVQVPGRGLVQVVLSCPCHWYHGDNLAHYLHKDRDEPMELGGALVRYATISDRESGKIHFVLTMHHALYDGWSMPLLVQRINQVYRGQTTTGRPAAFSDFIRYLSSADRRLSETFWRNRLEGATGPQFPSLPWPSYTTQANSLLEHYVPLERLPASNTTVATVIRGAWALIASRYSGSTDVVFGETLTGRNAPIAGVDQIEGPMITTVPIRIQVSFDTSVSEYLHTIQALMVEQIPHEHVGLQNIRRLSSDAQEACELRTGLVLHPSSEETQRGTLVDDLPASRLVPAGDAEAAQEALKFNTYALMLVCSLDSKGFMIMASFDSRTVAKSTMETALEQFARVAQQLCEEKDMPLAQIECLAKEDLEELAAGNQACTCSIGDQFPNTTAAWIVDPEDTNRLSPRGAVGELLVASQQEKTEFGRIEAPKWQPAYVTELIRNPPGNIYRTGFLASMSPDGDVILKGSKREASANIPQPRKPQHAITVSAISVKQKILRHLWSRILCLSEDVIGLDDSFFQLGGDSIAAMKLVSEARLVGLALTVAKAFLNRTLYEMANVTEDTEVTNIVTQEAMPFALMQAHNREELVVKIRSLLKDPAASILDILPARPLQEIAVKGTTHRPRYSARYELMYFDSPVDRRRLFDSCQGLISRNEILRTVFVEHGGACLAVVLERLDIPIVDFDVDGDVTEFTRQLCALDVQVKMSLGAPFIKFFFTQGEDGKSCLVLRISHAQYDEICLPMFLRQLSALYEQKHVPVGLPFSAYVNHVVQHNIPTSLGYWRQLLEDSSMSALRPDVPALCKDHYAIERTFDISARSRDVTVATIPTAAWALCLANRLGIRDVTFGEVVSGRNIDFPHSDAVMGPCWQYIPVRVRFDPSWTVSDLLAAVQHQHIASSAHEGVGLKEIIQHCTDWPATVEWFDSVVHQDVEHVQNLGFLETQCRMETFYPHAEPLREWKVQAFVAGESLTIEIVTFESWRDMATELLVEVGDILQRLVRQPESKLFQLEPDIPAS